MAGDTEGHVATRATWRLEPTLPHGAWTSPSEDHFLLKGHFLSGSMARNNGEHSSHVELLSVMQLLAPMHRTCRVSTIWQLKFEHTVLCSFLAVLFRRHSSSVPSRFLFLFLFLPVRLCPSVLDNQTAEQLPTAFGQPQQVAVPPNSTLDA